MNTENYPYCCYLATPAEIMALRPDCYELFWNNALVAEFNSQESAETYLIAEFCESL